jgi:hypothetical protein
MNPPSSPLLHHQAQLPVHLQPHPGTSLHLHLHLTPSSFTTATTSPHLSPASPACNFFVSPLFPPHRDAAADADTGTGRTVRLAHVPRCSYPSSDLRRFQVVRAPHHSFSNKTKLCCWLTQCCSYCLPFNFNAASHAPVSAMNPDLAYIVWVFYLSKVRHV